MLLSGTDLVLGGSVENLGDLHILVYTKNSQQVFWRRCWGVSLVFGSCVEKSINSFPLKKRLIFIFLKNHLDYGLESPLIFAYFFKKENKIIKK